MDLHCSSFFCLRFSRTDRPVRPGEHSRSSEIFKAGLSSGPLPVSEAGPLHANPRSTHTVLTPTENRDLKEVSSRPAKPDDPVKRDLGKHHKASCESNVTDNAKKSSKTKHNVIIGPALPPPAKKRLKELSATETPKVLKILAICTCTIMCTRHTTL